MNEKILFFIILFGIAILLISICIALFIIFHKETIILNYDCYVFTIFWTPTSCKTKKTGNYECFQRIKELNNEKYFTIHGLWPSLLSGEIPDSCNTGKNIVPNFDEDEDFKKKLENYWPGLHSNDTYLWTNEYNRHGYCYLKRCHYNTMGDYKVYFEKTVNLFDKGYRDIMEKILPDSKGVYNVSKEKFKNLLQKQTTNLNLTDNLTYYLTCDELYNELSEIRFVFDFNFERIRPDTLSENCPDVFVLNFTDESKIPVYQKYDSYIYSLSYGPTACKTRGKDCYNLLNSKKYNTFIIHGLWPTYKNGDIPQMCNIDKDIQIKDDTNFTYIKEFWYSLYHTDEYFWTHEYNEHGYCYIKNKTEDVLNYIIYFNKTFDLFNENNFSDIFVYIYANNTYANFSKFPREHLVNKTYLVTKLKELYMDDSFVLACKIIENKYYLEEIKFKLDLDFNLTSDLIQNDNCPEEFILETIRAKSKGKTNEDIWKTYDDYVFSIFWQPTTCKQYGYLCYERLAEIPKNIWTIHGLWPNYKNGTIPDWCNGENDIDVEIKNKSLYNYMINYWPGIFDLNEGFWGYEYNKHGYCYNQRINISTDYYEVFFLKAIEIYEKYNLANLFINKFGNKKGEYTINKTEFQEYLESINIKNNTYVLVCNKINNTDYISEMRIKFELNFTLFEKEQHVDDECGEIFMAELL